MTKAKLRTRRVDSSPILGGLFGQAPHCETRVSDGCQSRTAAGRNATAADRKAAGTWNRR